MKFIRSFSVLMPVHQREDIFLLFDKSIMSIFKNTLLPRKVFVLIDGVINLAFKKKIFFYKEKFNFQVLQSKKKIGLARILNLGINNVHTDWIIRADADDYNFPNRFAKLMNISNQKFDLIGSHVYETDFKSKLTLKKMVPQDQGAIARMFKYKNPFNHMSVAFKTKFVKECGGYPDISLKEDYALWANMFSRGARVKNLNMFLVNANTGSQMYNRRSGITHIISEIKLQKYLLKKRITNIFYSFFIGFIRILFYVTPSFLKFFFYIFFLRKKIKYVFNK